MHERAPKLAAIVLAAGRSERFGSDPPKQLARLGGETFVARAARLAMETPLHPVRVVLGHRADEVRRALGPLRVETVLNLDYATGQASSVKAALDDLPQVDGLVVLPIDQPGLDLPFLRRLVAQFDGHDTVVVPRCGERRGAPVLWGRNHLVALAQVEGDEGGRQILKALGDRVQYLELEDDRALVDIDTQNQLSSWLEQRPDSAR